MTQATTLSDEQLVEKIRSEDINLYAELMRRFQGKLLRYAVYLTNDGAIAADVVQESFINVYRNLHSFNANKSFSTWIYRIVHNQAINHLKKYRKDMRLEFTQEISQEDDLEDELVKKELIANLHRCLDQLSLKYKEPLALFFLEEKSYLEISDILRIPTGTVGTRINRAKKMIRNICRKQ